MALLSLRQSFRFAVSPRQEAAYRCADRSHLLSLTNVSGRKQRFFVGFFFTEFLVFLKKSQIHGIFTCTKSNNGIK
jgi:hypothetical protein